MAVYPGQDCRCNVILDCCRVDPKVEMSKQFTWCWEPGMLWVNEKLRLTLRAESNVDPTCKFWYLRIAASPGENIACRRTRLRCRNLGNRLHDPITLSELINSQPSSLIIIFTLATTSAHRILECLQESKSASITSLSYLIQLLAVLDHLAQAC